MLAPRGIARSQISDCLRGCRLSKESESRRVLSLWLFYQCLELDASCNREPVQGDKERCDMSPFGLAEDQIVCVACAIDLVVEV